MSWEAISAIGQMIGATAVVVSIVYLSIQIRANTRATRASASYQAAHSWAETNQQISQLPDSVISTIVGWYGIPGGTDTFTDADRARMSLLNQSIFMKLEGQYYLYKFGLLDADLWEVRRIDGHLLTTSSSNMQAWWKEAVFRHSPEFVRAIDSAPAPQEYQQFVDAIEGARRRSRS